MSPIVLCAKYNSPHTWVGLCLGLGLDKADNFRQFGCPKEESHRYRLRVCSSCQGHVKEGIYAEDWGNNENQGFDGVE